MASTVKHLRSSTANKRPTASGLADGQLAINTASGTPGLFLKDNAGAVVKVGPVHVGAAAPNATPAGSSGNSKGELWVNDTTTIHGLNYFSGSAFVNLTPSGTTTAAGLVELATDAETQTGTDTIRAVTPSGLQSKVSDSTSTTSSTTIASSTAVKAAFDLANAALPKSGGRVTGNLEIGPTGSLSFEGSTDDNFETFLEVVNPTADRTITFPNVTGTVVTTGDTGTVTSTMITDGTIVNADINASAGIVDTKLATISTAGKVSNSATTAVSANTVNAIVTRDGSGNFSAGTITAALTGNASTATKLSSARTFAVTGDITGTVSSDLTSGASIATSIAAGVIIDADVNASAAIGLSKLATGALPSGITVASANIVDGTIVNADINASAAIALSKLATGALPSAITVASTNIVDGTIVNADVNASAAIAGTKIAPNFGSQNVVTTGTNTAASLIPTGSSVPTNGVYLPAANTVGVATNGAGRLFINSTGQVSINTASDGIGFAQIRVGNFTSSLTPNGYFLTASNGALASNAGWIGGLTLESDAGGIPSVSLVAPNSTTAGAQTYQKAFEAAGSGANHRSVIYAGGTERLRITSAGLVGIGTSAPSTNLQIGTPATIDRSFRICSLGQTALDFETDGAAGQARIIGKNLTTGNCGLVFQTTSSGVVNSRLVIVQAGNVGIGTTSPTGQLTVSSNAPAIHLLESDGSSGFDNTALIRDGDVFQIQTRNQGTFVSNDYRISTNASGAIAHEWRIGNTERARIDSSGRLLVGTSTNSALSTLVLQGNSTSSNGAPFLFLQRGVSVPGADDALGVLSFGNNASNLGAQISVSRDGGTWTSGTSHPGRLVFSVTADGAASPTEALRISNNRAITVSDGGNVVLGTTTGTKIGTATTQKLGFYNATPVVQPAAVANATDAATVITQLNDLLAKLRTLGIIAT
jgi:trimeric autotransporter adhesin